MKSKILLAFFILALLLSSCITEYFTTLTNHKPMLFVDGSIVANTDAVFHITQSFALNVSGVPDEAFVNNAILRIIDSNGNQSEPAISLGRGRYQISIGELHDDVRYGIEIEHNGDIFRSTLALPLYTPEVEVRWTQYEPFGAVYFYLSTHDETDESRFFLWHYVEDWEIRTRATTLFYNLETNTFRTSGSVLYSRCWRQNIHYELGTTEALTTNSIIDQELLRIEPEGSRFWYLYSITVTQKAISQGAFEFHQNMKQQNEEMGGIFTPQPTEVLGNIRCITNLSRRVMGYVNTLKNVSRQKIMIRHSELIWPYATEIIQFEEYCRCNTHPFEFFRELGFTAPQLYREGFRPSRGDIGNLSDILWSPIVCVDCRELEDRATTNRPYFWFDVHRSRPDVTCRD